MVQLQRHGHVAVAMVDGAGGDALEGAGRQRDGQRQAARRQYLAHDRAALVEGDGGVGSFRPERERQLLRKALGIEPERGAGPGRLGNGIQHVFRPCFP